MSIGKKWGQCENMMKLEPHGALACHGPIRWNLVSIETTICVATNRQSQMTIVKQSISNKDRTKEN